MESIADLCGYWDDDKGERRHRPPFGRSASPEAVRALDLALEEVRRGRPDGATQTEHSCEEAEADASTTRLAILSVRMASLHARVLSEGALGKEHVRRLADAYVACHQGLEAELLDSMREMEALTRRRDAGTDDGNADTASTLAKRRRRGRGVDSGACCCL